MDEVSLKSVGAIVFNNGERTNMYRGMDMRAYSNIVLKRGAI
jgi:hypothetical protein